jgi:ADP-ribose pyrophosphatase YjhB (NUDIX family)
VTARHCVRCGAQLEGRPPTCPVCNHVHYLDPKLAACTIFRWLGGVFLMRRAIEPGYGLWTYPGGYVDRGETVEAAAVREAREEAGVGVRLDDLLGVYSYRGQTAVILVYRATVVEGEPRPLSESLDGRAFAEDRIPWDQLAFHSTAEALRDYLAVERGERAPGRSRNLPGGAG